MIGMDVTLTRREFTPFQGAAMSVTWIAVDPRKATEIPYM